jgi:hypothetical protein
MKAVTTDSLEANLKSVNQGAYYFGIIGRILLTFGMARVIALIGLSVLDPQPFDLINEMNGGRTLDILSQVIIGYLFLLARDAFTAISVLIKEIREIV